MEPKTRERYGLKSWIRAEASAPHNVLGTALAAALLLR
jgi:hypothetical protein